MPKFGKLNGVGRFILDTAAHTVKVLWGILVNPNLDFKVEKCIQDTNGRFLILDLLIDELHLILVENQLEDFAQENIIIAGDFNCAQSENDKKGGNPVWKNP